MKDNPLHIAVVIGSMRIGGAERATLHLINGLSNAGMKVELVLLHRTGEFLASVNKEIKIINLNKRKASHAVLVFGDYLKTNKPDLLFVVQNHIQLMVLLAVKFSSWKGKIVLNEQSTFSKNLKGFKGYFQKLLSKLLFEKADKITVVSEGAAIDFGKQFPGLRSKIQIIPNAIVTEKLLKVKDQLIDHPFFNLGYKVIIAAGRLTKSKNFDLLLRAFELIYKKENAKLIILGDGEERQNLKILKNALRLKDDVSFPGFVSNPVKYFSKADLFILSSDYEGLPGVIIEALACGCKIVSTNCESGPAEILKNGELGWLTPVGDVQALADSIVIALNTQINKELLIDRALDYHEDKIIGKYMDLFNSL